MEKKYAFDLSLSFPRKTCPILTITPVANYRIGKTIPYPINFTRLSVPIIFDLSALEEYELEYYLDFDNSIDEGGNNFKNHYRKRRELRRVLDSFISGADEIIRGALFNRAELKNKRLALVEDNGIKGVGKPVKGLLPFDGKCVRINSSGKKGISLSRV